MKEDGIIEGDSYAVCNFVLSGSIYSFRNGVLTLLLTELLLQKTQDSVAGLVMEDEKYSKLCKKSKSLFVCLGTVISSLYSGH